MLHTVVAVTGGGQTLHTVVVVAVVGVKATYGGCSDCGEGETIHTVVAVTTVEVKSYIRWL